MAHVIVDTDTFYECRSGQHEKCPAWVHSGHPLPYTETRCDCRCHQTTTVPIDAQKIGEMAGRTPDGFVKIIT